MRQIKRKKNRESIYTYQLIVWNAEKNEIISKENTKTSKQVMEGCIGKNIKNNVYY